MTKTHLKILFFESQQVLSAQIQPMLEKHLFTQSVDNLEAFRLSLTKEQPHLIIIDWPMPGILDSLEPVFNIIDPIPVIVIASKVELTKLEELGYLYFQGIEKPLQVQKIVEYLHHFAIKVLADENEPVAEDPSSKLIMHLARQVANYSVPVMISGESGVGKEVIARYIHDHSNRAKQPFVAINCAAIPATMLESVMFGFEKGAFTGALKSTPGKFEQAQYGTILLDEISEMPLELQAKLLRVLQEKEVERIGGQQPISLDIRVIATTNRNLQQEVAEGRFRMDLFYRLNVFPIHWIPLRQRKLDIVPLFEYLLKYHCQLMNREVPDITPAAKEALLSYYWPGNAREVDNVIQRTLIMQPNSILDTSDFQFDDFSNWKTTPWLSAVQHQPVDFNRQEFKVDEYRSLSLEDQEYELILKTLRKTLGNRTTAAKILKISPRTLRYKIAKMRQMGIDIPDAKTELLEINE